MELVNNLILSKLQSNVVSKEEFDFDRLSARPLLSMLSYSDLDKLYNIASSVRYSGDIEKKLKAIKEVMHSAGFRKLDQGTNRVIYKCLEDDSIVLKIALDRVGLRDNPAEFLNQEKLKPFVTKVFEVTPDGAVGEFERVQAITSREEFLTCASDIYDLLDAITSKYILADVGSMYFKNWAIRPGHSVCLLDFSYVYEADGDKLQCCAPDPNSPYGICGGWIDYDPGFNELRCIKCGSTYRAVDLAKDIKANKIIRKGRKHNMKVAVDFKGKVTKYNLNGEIVNNNEFKKSTPIVRPEIVKDSNNVGKLKISINTKGLEKKVPVVEEPKKEEVAVKEEVKTEEKVIAPVVEEEKKEEAPVVKEEPVVKKPTGMKVQITNKDGKTTEKVIDKKVEPKKTSGVKVKDNSNRHNNRVQITAVRLDQLKEMDFKYSSIDLEFHKMFFKAEYGESSVSVMTDFDSIPQEKLELLARIDSDDSAEKLKVKEEELEKAKADLLSIEDDVVNLRKIDNSRIEEINALKFKNSEMIAKIKDLEAQLNNKSDNKSSSDDQVAKLQETIDALKSDNQKQLEHISELEEINKQQHFQLERVIKENEELKTKPVMESASNEEVEEVTGEVEDAVYESDEEDVSQPSGFTFISGDIYMVNQLAEKYGIDITDYDIPSENVIVFNEADDSCAIRDAENKIVCMSYIRNIAIDDLTISKRTKDKK